MIIKDLKKLIENLPDDMKISYNDPNFGGPHWVDIDKDSFFIENNLFLISFPFETPVD